MTSDLDEAPEVFLRGFFVPLDVVRYLAGAGKEEVRVAEEAL